MGKGRVCLLLVGLLLAVALVPVRAQDFDTQWVIFAYLDLRNTSASLGELKTDPLDPTLEYFEAENAVSFAVYTLSIFSEVQLLLSGEDFLSGAERIPLEQMEWKLRGGNYRRMPAAGRTQEIMRFSGFGNYNGDLSLRLVLKGDESPGLYNSTLTLTLVNL